MVEENVVKGRTTPSCVPEPDGHQGQGSMVEEVVVKGRTTPSSVPEPDGW